MPHLLDRPRREANLDLRDGKLLLGSHLPGGGLLVIGHLSADSRLSRVLTTHRIVPEPPETESDRTRRSDMNEPDPRKSPPFNPRIYWWVAFAAIFWMLLLYWFTEHFNIAMGGS